MVVRSNYNLPRLYNMLETGYLEDIVKVMQKSETLVNFNVYIHFKRTNAPWNIDYSMIDRNTLVLVVVDESSDIPKSLSEKSCAVFKTYLTKTEHKNVFHLPVGHSLKFEQTKNTHDRETNVFFSGNLHVGRKELYASLSRSHFIPFFLQHRIRKILGEDFSNQFSNSKIVFTRKFATGLIEEEYMNQLSNSKIVLCPKGNPGVETIRHYEALAAGCIIVSEPLPKISCLSNAPYVNIKSWKSLKETIIELLAEKESLAVRQQASSKFYENNCSPNATVSNIEKMIEELH